MSTPFADSEKANIFENRRAEVYQGISMRLPLIATVVFGSLAGGGSPASAQHMGSEWPEREAIEHFLREAKITERKKIGEGITNPEKVTLELDGVVRNAIFKKVDKDHDSWRSEVAAYELDKLLGLGMVPPTVPRSIKGRKGCLQLWVTGTVMAKFEGEFPDIEKWREQVSVMWLFDDLTANIDRHLNNAMVSPDYNLMLIDNSKTFRYQKTLLNDLNGSGTGTHAKFWNVAYDAARERYDTRYPAAFIERLRRVTKKEIEDAIKPYIWGQDRGLVLERRDLILRRIDEMGIRALHQDAPETRVPSRDRD
jgi:hypothetical protein